MSRRASRLFGALALAAAGAAEPVLGPGEGPSPSSPEPRTYVVVAGGATAVPVEDVVRVGRELGALR